jgi:hypothetical protein
MSIIWLDNNFCGNDYAFESHYLEISDGTCLSTDSNQFHIHLPTLSIEPGTPAFSVWCLNLENTDLPKLTTTQGQIELDALIVQLSIPPTKYSL